MPRFLTLEILSAGPEDSARRRPFHLAYGGRRHEGVLQGSDALDADLALWSRLEADAAAEARMDAALRALLAPVWPRVELDLEAARAAGEPVRLDLVLNELELSGLPWELLQVQPFNLSIAHLGWLQLRYSLSNRPAFAPRPARCPVVVGWAGAVPIARHLEALREAWGADFDPAQCAVEADLIGLNTALSERRPAALHLLCHSVQTAPGETALVLRGRGGVEERVSPKRMKEILAQHELQLVVLCVCGLGDLPRIDGVSSMARELHAVGIPAVIAARLPLSKAGSIELTRALYGQLGEGGTVEEALVAARQRLRPADESSRDAEAMQLYAVPGQDSRLRVEREAPQPVRPLKEAETPPNRRQWAIGLGAVALVALGVYAWIAQPGPGAVAPPPPLPPTVPDPALKVRIPSLERTDAARAAGLPRAECGASAFGASVRLARGSWVLVGDPSALGGRGQVYTYDKNRPGDSLPFARHPVEDPKQISTVGDPLAGGPEGAGLGADIAEFGNGNLFIAAAASESRVPPYFEPGESTEAPDWLGPALEAALGGEAPLRAVGWSAGGLSAFAMATARRVVALLFDGEGQRGQTYTFALDRAFVAGFYVEGSAGGARGGTGLFASGTGGDCGAGSACTVLYAFSAARTVWPIGGGPVAVGDFDGLPGLDGAVFDVASSSVWILPDLSGKLGNAEMARLDPGAAAFHIPGLPPGALAGRPEALSLVSLGTLDGDAAEDLAIGVPFTKRDGTYGEGGVLVRRSEQPGLLNALRVDNDRAFAEEPRYRAVSLSFDPDMGPGGTLAIGATGLFATDGASSCGGVVLLEDPMRLLGP